MVAFPLSPARPWTAFDRREDLMSDRDGTAENPIRRKTTGTRALNIALWALQIVLALQFASAGYLKLSGDHAMVALFATIGAGQWFRYVVGSVEVAGAIGLLIPVLRGVAALGLTILMVGASATQVLIVGSNQWLPITVLVLCVLVAWGRWSQTRALAARLSRRALTHREPGV